MSADLLIKQVDQYFFYLSNVSMELIKNAEGWRNKVYIDDLGNPTIGWGFDLRSLDNKYTHIIDEELKKSNEISLSTGNLILQHKITDLVMEMNLKIENFKDSDTLTQATLVDMAYNMGVNSLQEFKNFLHLLFTKQIIEAINDMASTLYYAQVKDRATRNLLNFFIAENKCFNYSICLLK